MALMNRWEVSNFLDSRKGRDWIPDFVGERFDFGGLSTAVNMDNGLGKSSVTEAVLWMLSRDRELGRKTRPRIAPDSDGRFTHIRCEFVEPEEADLFSHGERITGETWVFGYYGNRGEDCFYAYPGTVEDCPIHLDEIDETGDVYKVCIPDEEFRANLSRFKNAVIASARDWALRVRQFMSGAQLDQLVAYQKKGGGDKAATFYDVKVARGEQFDEAFFRQYVAPEILVGVGDFDDDIDARGFDRKIVAQAQSVIDAKIQVRAKGEIIARGETTLAALRAVNDAARLVLDAEQGYREQADKTSMAVSVVRATVERWGIAGMPVGVSGTTREEDLQALIHGGIEIGGDIVISQEWLDTHLPGIRLPSFKVIDNGVARVLPLSTHPFTTKSRATPARYVRVAEVLGRLEAVRDRPDYQTAIERIGRLADKVRRQGETGLRRLMLTARAAFEQAGQTVRALEEERSGLERERAGLFDLLTRFETNEAAFARMRGSGLFTEDELADPRVTGAKVEAARIDRRDAVQAHLVRTSTLEQVKARHDRVVAEFGATDDLRGLIDDLLSCLDAADRASAKAQDAYQAAKKAYESLREDERAIREDQAAARKAVEEFTHRMADMRTFLDRFGRDADPAIEAERLTEARDAAQADEARHEEDARRAAAEMNGLERDRALLRDAQDKRLTRIGALETLEPLLRAFEAAHPGRAADSFLAEETQRRADGLAQAAAAGTRRDALAGLVRDLDRFEADHPGTAPQAWLADAETRRGKTAIALDETARRIAKAQSDLAALRAFQVAPTETDDRAAALLADLPHRPLHAAILQVDPAPRRADLLDHFSALLFAPVFTGSDAAAQAARRLAEAGLPVPVLIESDLAAWLNGDTATMTRRDAAGGEIVSGLFAGVRTPTVEAILDPEALRRRREETQARLDLLIAEEAALRETAAMLAPEGEACRTARAAAEAIEREARDRHREAVDEARGAAERIAAAEANLTADARARADGANRYLAAGGDEALRTARAEAERTGEQLADLDQRQDAARTRRSQAENALGLARRRARAAEAEAAQWLPWCDKARAVIAAGGADELKRRERAAEQADDRHRQITDRIGAAVIETAAREEARDRAVESCRVQQDRMNRWREPLLEAAAFVESGGREELARAAETLAELRSAEAREEERRRFEFDAAALFVASGGAAGVEPAKLRFEEIRRRLEQLDGRDLPQAGTVRDESERWLRTVSDAHAAMEQRLAAVLFTYQKIVADGGLDAIPMVADAALADDFAIAARLTDAAIDPDGPHDADSLDRVVADYEALAERIGGFDIERLREDMKGATTRRQNARDQYKAAIEREVDPSRHLDAAIMHKLDGARDRPGEIAALLATVDGALAWERTLHAKAQDGLSKVQDELVSILRGIAGSADVNLRRLKKVLTSGEGAKIHLNVTVANDEQIGTVLERTVDDIETERTRFLEDQAKGKGVSEDLFTVRMTNNVRETVYQRMFVKGGDGDHAITIEHPTMREGRPFRFEKDGISGGQATALTLLWTIKLAEFSVARETAALSASATARRRAGSAQHSIVIVDGLFSDLSKQELIDESMEAMQGIKGSFQLIGLIHSPYYRNNWKRFPTLILGRKVASTDDRGRKSEAVAIEGQRLVRGRVMALTYGARDGLAPA